MLILTRAQILPAMFLLASLGGCAGSQMDVDQMTAASVADLQPSAVETMARTNYRIGVGDKLNVRVFQVPDLSTDNLVVDTSGDIHMPLIGAVRGIGLTPAELAREIEGRLGVRYLRNPNVTVAVTEAANQKITIDGAVSKPGVYEMRGATSLLQAVAMAEGPTRVADISKVAVFRTIDGQRSVALFDLGAIRQGRAADPAVLGDDIIVVDTSRLNSAMRDILGAIPALSIFRPF